MTLGNSTAPSGCDSIVQGGAIQDDERALPAAALRVSRGKRVLVAGPGAVFRGKSAMSSASAAHVGSTPELRTSLRELALLFLRLGTISFGGPAAHIAMMENEVVRRSRTAGAFLDGVNVGSLALVAVVTFTLGRAAVVDVTTVLLAAASAFFLLRFRANSAWLVLGGALIGLAANLLA